MPNEDKDKFLSSMEVLDAMVKDEVTTDEIAVVKDESYPIYGYLVAYTFGEAWIPEPESEKIWTLRGIPIRPSTHIDAVKKAIAKYKECKYGDDTLYRIRFKGMEHPDDRHIYYWEISKHVKDTPIESQTHASIALIRAKKFGKAINPEDIEIKSMVYADALWNDVNLISEEERHIIIPNIFNPIVELYERLITHVNNDMVRDTVIKHIKMHKGIPFIVGRGGAWFIPVSERDFVMTLKTCIQESQAYAVNRFGVRIIPVVKDDDLRSAIASDVQAYVKQEFLSLLRSTMRRLESTDNEQKLEAILGDAFEAKNHLMGVLDDYKALLKTTIAVHLDAEEEPEVENPMLMSGRLASLLNDLRSVD